MGCHAVAEGANTAPDFFIGSSLSGHEGATTLENPLHLVKQGEEIMRSKAAAIWAQGCVTRLPPTALAGQPSDSPTQMDR
jgi:hypothetical protein